MSEAAFSFDRIGTALILGIGIPVTVYQANLHPLEPHIDTAHKADIKSHSLASPNVSSNVAVPDHPASAAK